VQFARESLSQYVPFRLTPTQYAAVKGRAEDLGVGVGDVIRLALETYFRKKS
jgi:hypothetical protein